MFYPKIKTFFLANYALAPSLQILITVMQKKKIYINTSDLNGSISFTVLYSTFYSNTFIHLPELKVIRQQ